MMAVISKAGKFPACNDANRNAWTFYQKVFLSPYFASERATHSKQQKVGLILTVQVLHSMKYLLRQIKQSSKFRNYCSSRGGVKVSKCRGKIVCCCFTWLKLCLSSLCGLLCGQDSFFIFCFSFEKSHRQKAQRPLLTNFMKLYLVQSYYAVTKHFMKGHTYFMWCLCSIVTSSCFAFKVLLSLSMFHNPKVPVSVDVFEMVSIFGGNTTFCAI